MKKKIVTIISSLALVAVMLFAFCACSSYGGIKKNYEGAGYKEVEMSDSQKETVKKFVGEEFVDKVTVHVLQKEADKDAGLLGNLASSLSVVIIVEFKTDKDMVDSLQEKIGKENVENAYEELQKLSFVNGNCALVLCTVAKDAELFKK